LELSDFNTLSIEVRSRLMKLRTQRFAGQNTEPPKEFHARCLQAAEDVADEQLGGSGISKSMAMGCLYDIVDRCQLEFLAQ